MERQLGHRPFFESMVFDNKIATPLLSQAGLGEFGLFSALSGVPLLALALLSCRRMALAPTILYALPGLFFLVRWWPPSAPFNLDLMLSVFPVSLPRAGWWHPPAERRCAPSSCSPACTCSSGRLSAAESLPGWTWRHDARHPAFAPQDRRGRSVSAHRALYGVGTS